MYCLGSVQWDDIEHHTSHGDRTAGLQPEVNENRMRYTVNDVYWPNVPLTCGQEEFSNN